ncbi:hypothetical protein HN011_010858 [Eciton burchellii]|nr:hypothetical protein HN011_010858 [Eciton burchellii]
MNNTGNVPSNTASNTSSNALSALDLLRSYDFFDSNSDLRSRDVYQSQHHNFLEPNILSNSLITDSSSSSLTPSSLSPFSLPRHLLQPSFLTAMPPLMHSLNTLPSFSSSSSSSSSTTGTTNYDFITTNTIIAPYKKPRNGRKSIPDDQKDEQYFQKRKRNNQAAKRSRDARKIREDHIALKAKMLEHENTILKVQIATLREEAQSLRYILIKHIPTVQSIERSSSITTAALSSLP